jgi:hypothetical protein
MTKPKQPARGTRSQIQKFKEAARAHGASEDEAEFNRTLGKLGKVRLSEPPKPKKPRR